MNQATTNGVPPAPKKGMVIWVQAGTHWSIGTAYFVSRVNGRSFYTNSQGRSQRFLLSEWSWWLSQRFAEGKVLLNGRVLNPSQLDTALIPALPEEAVTDIAGRDARFLRAAGDVVKHYQTRRQDKFEGVAEIQWKRGNRQYTVTARTDWATPPTCTCPDSQRGTPGRGRICKHIIASCISHDDLRCQLLDIML